MDIIKLPVDYDKKKIDSKYRLVIIGAQRARELALGATPKISAKAKKITTSALIEALSGEIDFLIGDEAIMAREKAERFDYKKLMEEKRRPIADLSELERDLKVYLHEKGATEKALDELFNDSDTEEGDESESSEE
jgi:DNA-directed RNA polymerase subunit omega